MKILDELEKLSKAATKGPWEYKYHEPYEASIETGGYRIDGISVYLDDAPVPDFNNLVDNNAKLIAASRNHIDALIRVARAAQEVNDFCHHPKIDEALKALESGGEGE